MKSYIKAYQKAVQKVSEIEQEIEVTKVSNHYTVFSNEGARQVELSRLRQDLREAIGMQISAIENLQIKLNLEKSELNTQVGFLTIAKAS